MFFPFAKWLCLFSIFHPSKMTLLRKIILFLPFPPKTPHMHVLFCPPTQTVDCGKDSPPLRGRGSELSPGVLLTSWWPEAPAVFGKLSFPFNEGWRGEWGGGTTSPSLRLPACFWHSANILWFSILCWLCPFKEKPGLERKALTCSSLLPD